MGPAGLIIGHQLSVTAGPGFWEFSVGPTVEVGTSVGVSQGSSIGIVSCRGANVTMSIRGGVWWSIPRPVVEVVNFFLRIVGVKQVQNHDSLYTKWQKLLQQQAQSESHVCGSGSAL